MTPTETPTPPKQLPPWVQILINAGFAALAIFLAAKYGIVIPTPQPAPVPQAQPLVVVVGQPATAQPVMAAQK